MQMHIHQLYRTYVDTIIEPLEKVGKPVLTRTSAPVGQPAGNRSHG